MPEGRAPALRIAVAQFDAVPGDLKHNLDRHLSLVDRAAGAGAAVVLFPELSVSGYCSSLLERDSRACAIEPESGQLDGLRSACATAGVAAVVGAPVADGGHVYLSAIAIGRSGETAAVYHKMYLDNAEQRWFARGDRPQTLSLDGWRLGLGICYDSSFPEHARGYALAGADGYLVSGAFPRGRSDFRRTIYFPARSLENTVYLAFSNYVGGHDGLDYGGMSAIHGPDGRCLADAGSESEGLAVQDLQAAVLDETREHLRMLNDCRVPAGAGT